MSAPAAAATPELDHLPDVLPVLPMRDTVVFPFVIVPLSVSTEDALAATDEALAGDRLLVLANQKNRDVEQPGPDDVHRVATVATVVRMLRLPDGRIRLLMQGKSRVRIDSISTTEPFMVGRVSPLESQPIEALDDRARAAMRDIVEGLDQAASLGRPMAPDVVTVAAQLEDPGRLADLTAANLDLEPEDAQPLLEELDPVARMQAAREHLHRELHLLDLQSELANQARDEIDRSQRDYVLRQQMRAIQEELGEGSDFESEIAGYRELAKEKGLSEAAVAELEKQIRRLERSHPDSAETTVIRTYLDTLTQLPWASLSEDQLELDRARAILDEDHYGLDKVKERIVEYLAVRRLRDAARGPILCFVGPPGVGKTSLGRSIARALGRSFVRLSLGGVRDEAEIRGHRRTYVGAMTGRVLQSLTQAGTSNPVFMLDEIDKIGRDGRGDPESAMLEVLDPEQNTGFRDHYLGLDYDLSRVMFITTANQLDPIQPAFLDRMEVIRLSGYTDEEKRAIARRHLIPKQRTEHGLDTVDAVKDLRFTDGALDLLIRGRTRECGLRGLERELAAICRKLAVRLSDDKVVPRKIDTRAVSSLLGAPTFDDEDLLDRDRVGVATGLAWTALGGELLLIEVATVPGSGKLKLTGRLGEVMQESAQAALTYARRFAERQGLDEAMFKTRDIHIHAPAGAVPKDGPSAGITIATALVSALTNRRVDRQVAMTGEVTLRGSVLAIGGLREKALAARTAGIKTVIIPAKNERHVRELPPALRRALTFEPVDHMDRVIDLALKAADTGNT